MLERSFPQMERIARDNEEYLTHLKIVRDNEDLLVFSASHVATHEVFKMFNIIIVDGGVTKVHCYHTKGELETMFTSIRGVKGSWRKLYKPYFESHDNASIKCYWLLVTLNRTSSIIGLTGALYDMWIEHINAGLKGMGKAALDVRITLASPSPATPEQRDAERAEQQRKVCVVFRDGFSHFFSVGSWKFSGSHLQLPIRGKDQLPQGSEGRCRVGETANPSNRVG